MGNLWDQLAARVERARRSEDRPDEHGARVMARLDELLPLAHEVEQEIDREIVRAREQGMSWSLLGATLHMSKQGAQHRYRVAMVNLRRAESTVTGAAPRTMAELEVKRA